MKAADILHFAQFNETHLWTICRLSAREAREQIGAKITMVRSMVTCLQCLAAMAEADEAKSGDVR